MVKKIKVVEINTSNPEANQEAQETIDPTPMQEPIAQASEPVSMPESIPQAILGEEPVAQAKAKKPRAPRAPREQKLVRPPKEKVEEPPVSESDSIDTEEMVAVIKNHRASKKQPAPAKEEEIKWVAHPSGLKLIPEPPEPPAPQAQAKAVPQAKEEKATCPDCNKVMSVKSLKYTHANNCKAKQAPKQQPIKMVESVEPSGPVQHPISVLLAAERVMRMGQRRERIESLLSNAF